MIGNSKEVLVRLRTKITSSDLVVWTRRKTGVVSIFTSDSLTMCGSDDVHLREAIQEASSTAYVRGRWIYANSQYKIISTALPSHGDYSEYNIMGKLFPYTLSLFI